MSVGTYRNNFDGDDDGGPYFRDRGPYEFIIAKGEEVVYRLIGRMNQEQITGAGIAFTLLFFGCNNDVLTINAISRNGIQHIHTKDETESIFRPQVHRSNSVDVSTLDPYPGTYFWVKARCNASIYLISTRDPVTFLQGFITLFQIFGKDYRPYIISPIYYRDNNRVLHEQMIA